MSTEERAARVGDNYPYFIYATGSVKLKNRSTGEEILNSTFKDAKGADFSSKDKAGINALKKLFHNQTFPNSENLAKKCISLPIDPTLSLKEIYKIIKVLNSF